MGTNLILFAIRSTCFPDNIGPLPPTIHRGLEWPQVLNSLFLCLSVSLSVCLSACLFSANFLILYSTVQYSIVQYSTVQYSTVQYCTVHYSTVQFHVQGLMRLRFDCQNLFFKRSGHTVMWVCLFVCLLVLCKFSNFLQYSTVQYSTVRYSTVQYSTVQYSTVQYITVQYSIYRSGPPKPAPAVYRLCTEKVIVYTQSAVCSHRHW